MAKQSINVGTTANDKKGDSLRAAFQKVNANFTELYEAVGLAATGQDTALTFLGSTLSTDDSSSIVIDRATTVTSNLSVGGDLLPQTANGGDLGSSTLPWRSLYVSNNTIFIGGVPLGIDANGNLTVNSSPVTGGGGGGSTLVNGAYTVSLDANGNITFPQGTLLGYSDPGGFIIDGAVDKDIAIYTYSGADAHGWTFGTDGNLTLPNGITIDASAGFPLVTIGGANTYITIDDGGAPPGFTITTNGDLGPKNWRFDPDGDLTLPAGGDILDSEGNSVLGGGSYTPDDSDNWNSPTVNTVAAALDELAAKVAALENFEIDGGNAYTPAAGELIIDGNGA